MAAAAAFVKPPLEIVLQLSTDRGRGSSVALKSTTGSSTQPGAQKVVLMLDQAALTGSAHMQRSHAVLTQGNSKATARQPQATAGNRKATGMQPQGNRKATAMQPQGNRKATARQPQGNHVQRSHAALACSAHMQRSQAALTRGSAHMQRSQAALTRGSAHMQRSHAALTSSAHMRQCSHAALTQGNRHRTTRSTCCNYSDVYIMSN